MDEPMEMVRQKLAHLRHLVEHPGQNRASVLRTFHDLFQLTHEGRDLLPDTTDWLTKTASLFLSPNLWDVLVKHSLEVYGFQLAALCLTDVEDVIDDLSNNGEILKSILSFPLGAINKLKRELLGGAQQQRSYSQPTLEPAVEEVQTSKKRLAEEILPRCLLIGKNSNKLDLYELPLTKAAPSSSSSKADRWVFGSPSPTQVESKTILLVGVTGSGKTTLINAMVNYILGVEWDDTFRFMLINEERDRIKSKLSKTSKVTAYELHHQKGFKIPYSLIIVDTPGYRDTTIITERNYEITDSIHQFFNDDMDIQVLDAVGLTVQATLACLTPTQNYMMHAISTIFGYYVRDNTRFLVTFTADKVPPVLEAIRRANITHQPLHHQFNNSGFFTSNQMDGYSDFCQTSWKLGMQNFESFFIGLSSMKTISFRLSQERKRIYDTIEELVTRMYTQQLNKIEQLRKTKQELIENHLDHINTNKNFESTVTICLGRKRFDGDNTNCSKCSMTCHHRCTAGSEGNRNCSAMDSDGFCTKCPNKCKWDLHIWRPHSWEFSNYTVTRTYEDIKKKYEDAFQQKLSTEGVLHAMEAEEEQIKLDLKQDTDNIIACLQRLDEIALRSDSFTSTDYIELLIQAEIKRNKLGFQGRIVILNSILDNARAVKIEPGEEMKQLSILDPVLAPW